VSKPLQTLVAGDGIGEHDASVPGADNMKIIDRATRGMAARFIWGGLVVLCLIGLFVVRGQKVTALNEQVQDADARVEAYAKTTIADQAIVDTRGGTISFDKKDFDVAVEGDIFTDPTVARVRIWNKDGLLLASTDPDEVVGQLKVTPDANFTDALASTTRSHVVQEDFTFSTVGSQPQPTQLLEVTTPFMVRDQVDPAGVVQVDMFYGRLETAAATPWDTWSRVFIIGLIIAGILFVVALVWKPARRSTAAEEPAEEETKGTPAVTDEPVPVPVADATPSRDQELEQELQIAREQLQQASEAFAFLEHRVKDGPGSPASAADIEAAGSRIAELETALQRAEEEAAAARSGSIPQEELDRVRREADERVAALERQLQADATKVDPEMETLRAQLADAEARARGAEDALASARADVAAAIQEVETVPNGDAPTDLIKELEAKVAEAEERAKEAEEEALRVTPEANDLRARLAQAAARKKLGPSG
jgi:chemotaxis protein histidine kinase CheA